MVDSPHDGPQAILWSEFEKTAQTSQPEITPEIKQAILEMLCWDSFFAPLAVPIGCRSNLITDVHNERPVLGGVGFIGSLLCKYTHPKF